MASLKLKPIESILFLLIAALTGCNVSTPSQSTLSPLQSPIPTVAVIVTSPTLSIANQRTATIGGRLLRLNGSPIKKVTVYLAVVDKTSQIPLASIDPLIAPRTETDSTGFFTFQNVQPDQYTVVVLTPLGRLILPQNSAGKPLVVDAKADVVTSMDNVSIVYDYPDGE